MAAVGDYGGGIEIFTDFAAEGGVERCEVW
jgi:hypothetical protein